MWRSVLIIGDGSHHLEDLFQILLVEDWYVPYFTAPLGHDFKLSQQSLGGFRDMILSPGDTYPPLSQDFQKLVKLFVEDGGLLICLPFTAYSAQHHGNDIIGNLLPVKCSNFFEDRKVEVFTPSLSRAKEAPDNIRTTSVDWVRKQCENITFNISGEYLDAKQGSEVLGLLSIDGERIPLGIRWTVGRGQVFYFNASYHSHGSTDSFFMKSDGGKSLLYDLLHIWRFDCSLLLEPPAATKVEVVRFVEELGRQFQRKEYRVEQSPEITFTPYGMFEGTYAHYGYGHSVQSLLFPTMQEFTSLPFPARAVITRCLLTTTKMLWANTELTAPGLDYINEAFAEVFRPTNANKKKFFESLVAYFLSLTPELRLDSRNLRTASGEIDLLFRNTGQSGLLQKLGDTVPVECKMWGKPSGAKEMRDFIGKVEDLGCISGIIVSYDGFTGTGQRESLRIAKDALRKGLTIIPLDQQDLTLGLCFIDTSTILEKALFRLRTA